MRPPADPDDLSTHHYICAECGGTLGDDHNAFNCLDSDGNELGTLFRDGGDRKDTNPKDAVGIAKVPLSTVPTRVLAELGLAMMEGALKYGRHNFRSSGVRASVYYDATIRHLFAWWEGQDIDPDSGLNHIVKAMACLTVLRDSMIQENLVDDRPPQQPKTASWIDELNERAKNLLERYPNPQKAHTQK